MRRLFALSLLIPLIANAQQAKDIAEHFCGEATGIYLPEPKGTPAPNIELANFQYMSPDDRCARNVEYEELMRLHAGIKPLAAAAFTSSKANFGVMVRYTLTQGKPATFDMQVRDAPETERGRLTQFHHQAAALQNYHSTSGTVYVVFHYTIAPGASTKPTARD